MTISNETIAAIATPQGRGGIGIIRISGPNAFEIASRLLKRKISIPERTAVFSRFLTEDGNIIDEGIVLAFKGPQSFTGEDVIELQGHGGPIVMNLLLKRVVELGARMARPGEFSERAFLNDKLDLTQAEAIADLINAGSEQAAKSAARSLTGAFSQKVNNLVEELTQLRTYVEAAIDFPDEEIDFLNDGHVESQLRKLQAELESVFAEAKQGALLKEGMHVVIAGRPNAGKSSLLNSLAGYDAAIVTPIPGTTRDILREHIQIDGMPLHIVDTAGLRETEDLVEKEGVRRALLEVEKADCVLFVYDASTVNDPICQAKTILSKVNAPEKFLFIANKCDLLKDLKAGLRSREDGRGNQYREIVISAQTGEGISHLRTALKTQMGFQSSEAGVFSARTRHLEALSSARVAINVAIQQLVHRGAGELVAEDLRLAQNSLSEITGEVTSEDLLGRIFSTFCIGK